MEANTVEKDEIMERFIVRLQYGTSHDDGTEESWPHATTALCIIVGTDDDKIQSVSHLVRRNGNEKHAEQLLIDYLKTNNEVQSLTSIEVYQNYSPCRDCANEILEYIEETKKPFKLTIIFANFYKTHVYPGNDEKSADDNIEGLQLLLKAGVNLRLLGGCTKWEEFLNMNQFICLTEEEKIECLEKAKSDARKVREEQDRWFYGNIICEVESLTKEFDSVKIK